MATTGKVHHWKHGWIPLDATAQAIKDGKATGGSHKIVEADVLPDVPNIVKAERVEGYNSSLFVETGFNTPLSGAGFDNAQLTSDQKHEIAGIVDNVAKQFPELTKDDPILIDGAYSYDEFLAATTSQTVSHHGISVDPALFNDKKIMEQFQEWRDTHGLVAAADTDNLKDFRAAVITHELGHVLHMRAQDKLHQDRNADNDDRLKWGLRPYEDPIDNFISEPVDTTTSGKRSRWSTDTLDNKSAYAVTDPYEWWAEALTDGLLGGAKASASGKEAVKIAHQLYGGGGK